MFRGSVFLKLAQGSVREMISLCLIYREGIPLFNRTFIGVLLSSYKRTNGRMRRE